MVHIALTAVVGILALQATDAIPLASAGGSLTIGLAFLLAALAGGMLATLFGAWGALWIVNRWRAEPKPV